MLRKPKFLRQYFKKISQTLLYDISIVLFVDTFKNQQYF